MALGRHEKREMTFPLLTETARLWHCAVVPPESKAIGRLAGRLDSSLAVSGSGLPVWLSQPAAAPAGEQALDLRVAGRRRTDSLDRSPSPAESESPDWSTAGRGRLPFAEEPSGAPVSAPGQAVTLGALLCSPVAAGSICSSPPQLGSVCSSPPQLGSVCSSPSQFGSICSSPGSPGSPERVVKGRQTSVIRRLVLERPTQSLQQLQANEPPHQEQHGQHHQQQREQHTEQQLHQHAQQPQQQHPCDQCGRKYSTASNLARHRQLHCLPTDKKARKCPECDKIYVSMPAFSMHVRTHAQGCRCPYCGKSFSRPWLLQGHVRTHTGERPFRCSVCAKAFADKSNLRAHVQTHSSVKPHVCQRCGKAFALKSYLYKHEESSCMKERRAGREAKDPLSATKAEMAGDL